MYGHLLQPVPSLDQRQAKLEADILDAWATVKAARQAWARSPNADTVKAAEEARVKVDGLLDQRLSLGLERIAEQLVRE